MTSLRLPLLLLVLILPASSSAQVTVEGRVTDGSGVPVADADLDFFESGSGAKVDPSAPGFESQSDKTDIFGEYEMVVIPEVYDIRYEPPANRPDLAPIFVREIILGTDRVQDVTLPEGSRLGGTLRDPDGAPVAGADLDVRDPDTGTKIATVRDDTDADGRFDTTVIRGEWDVVFRPPVGSGAGPLRLERVDLNSDLETDVTLPRGFTLTGVVQRGDGSRVRGADLDFENVETARRVPTSDDATDTDGSFRINVPEGALHVFITPPPGQGLAPSAIWDVGMDADLDLGTLTLTSGVLVEGVVTDPSGMPIAGADLDLWVAGTCRRFPAAGADTDAVGRYSLRVQPGSYDVVVNPPGGPICRLAGSTPRSEHGLGPGPVPLVRRLRRRRDLRAGPGRSRSSRGGSDGPGDSAVGRRAVGERHRPRTGRSWQPPPRVAFASTCCRRSSRTSARSGSTPWTCPAVWPRSSLFPTRLPRPSL